MRKTFAILLILVLTGCGTFRPTQDLDAVLTSNMTLYEKSGADGSDVIAMLSYLSKGYNEDVPETWDGYWVRMSNYVQQAENVGISSNYPVLAGSNEIAVVTHFGNDALGYVKSSELFYSVASGAADFESVAGSFIVRIMSHDYNRFQ